MDAQQWELLWFALYGGSAAFVASITRTGRLVVPRPRRRRDPDGDEWSWDLGSFAAAPLGALLAAVFDGRPQTAIAYGLAAGVAGPALLSALTDPLLKKLGLDPKPPILETNRES